MKTKKTKRKNPIGNSQHMYLALVPASHSSYMYHTTRRFAGMDYLKTSPIAGQPKGSISRADFRAGMDCTTGGRHQPICATAASRVSLLNYTVFIISPHFAVQPIRNINAFSILPPSGQCGTHPAGSTSCTHRAQRCSRHAWPMSL